MMLRVYLSALLLLGSASAVVAQSCAGVEGRVNSRTSALTTAVTGTITTATTTYLAQQLFEQQQIMSALRVLGAQSNASSDQEIGATNASAKALAQTIVEESTISSIAEAAEEFGHVGYNACAVTAAAQTIATANTNAAANGATVGFGVMSEYGAQTMPAFEANLQDWNNLALNGPALTVDDVMSGDPTRTEQFTRLVLGPPVPPVPGGGVATELNRVQSMERRARQSAAAQILSDVSAEVEIRDAMQDFHDEFFGADGGEEWAASQAASPARGVLLDMARLEAANLAATALQLRKSLREEYGLAVYTLAVIDERVSDWEGVRNQ